MTRLPIRSFLFIPGDSEKKLAKVDDCGADAVILDLEDAVAPENKAKAREMVAEFLGQRRGERRPQIWVRVNPLDTGMTEGDLAAIIAGRPDGIIQPKTDRPADVGALSAMLDVLEAERGLPPGAIPIVPVATETAIAPFHLGDYATAGLSRLAGLTWGAEDLATAIGATTNRDANGEWLFTFRMVRSLTLLAAHAAGVQAIDTLYADFRDEAGLRQTSLAARAEGFSGRLAIHPAQVAIINECFTPTMTEVEHARCVLDAFAASPGAGTVGLDGKMLDIPHRKQAERIIAEAKAFGLVEA
jgi:citrate lyase subunit beta / citryl-CoA lyase